MTADMDHGSLETFLQRGRDIAMLVRDFFIGHTAFNERFIKMTPGRAIVLPLIARTIDSEDRYFYTAVRRQMNQFVKIRPIPLGIAIGREPHDFVLVGIEIEPQMQGDKRIKNSNGMSGRNSMQKSKVAAAAMVYGDAFRL